MLVILVLAAGYEPAKAAEGFEPAHKVVIQVDSADVKEQQLALNNAANLLKHYGPDNIKIELVAYGPGLKLLTDKSESKERIRSLSQQDIQFSACANTMQGIKRRTGKEPVLTEGVKIVPAGVARIIELQEQGYSYIRP
ncbi:MAG: hypothetical protein GC149_11295 [Gammaproteobacteria bacterium]|nr:hypothetical protein [Gammaproteobacteria bacterium]